MKIVVLDGYTLNPGDLSWDRIHQLGDLTVFDRTARDKILERSQGAEILLTNKTPLDRETLDRLPSLRYIGVLATGYNVIDIDAAQNNLVVVSNAPGYGTLSVAQMTIALLLELCLHVQRHSDAVKSGEWSSSKDWCFWNYQLIELSGKTMGIIGFGDIGQKVADLATAFNMHIVATSRNQTDQSHRKNFEWKSLEELLEVSDVVTLHCPLTSDTKGIINTQNLKKMKRSAFLINTSRGPLVEEEELSSALNDGIIAGAAVDVLGQEPPIKDNPLISAKNCIVTPHIAWATKESRKRLLQTVVENLEAFLDGNPKNIVNKHSAYQPKA